MNSEDIKFDLFLAGIAIGGIGAIVGFVYLIVSVAKFAWGD